MGRLRTFILIGLFSAAACWRAPAQNREPEPRTESEILKSLKLPEGYEATIFASPPQLGYPTACQRGDRWHDLRRGG